MVPHLGVTGLLVLLFGSGVRSQFTLLQTASKFSEARALCQRRGDDLARVTSKTQLQAVGSVINKIATREVWLGMRYDGKVMRWLDGSEVTVSQWDVYKDDEPDDLEIQQCAVIRHSDLLWDSRKCDDNYLPLCGPAISSTTATATNTTSTTTPTPTTTKASTTVPTTTATTTTITTTKTTTWTSATSTTATAKAPITHSRHGRNVTVVAVELTTSVALGLDEGFAQEPIKTFKTNTITECYVKCSVMAACTHFATSKNKCRLYSANESAGRISEPGTRIWRK